MLALVKLLGQFQQVATLAPLCCRYWDDKDNLVKHDVNLDEHHDVYGEYKLHSDDNDNPLVISVDTEFSLACRFCPITPQHSYMTLSDYHTTGFRQPWHTCS